MHIVTYMVYGKRNSRISYVISKEEDKTGVRNFYFLPCIFLGEDIYNIQKICDKIWEND